MKAIAFALFIVVVAAQRHPPPERFHRRPPPHFNGRPQGLFGQPPQVNCRKKKLGGLFKAFWRPLIALRYSSRLQGGAKCMSQFDGLCSLEYFHRYL